MKLELDQQTLLDVRDALDAAIEDASYYIGCGCAERDMSPEDLAAYEAKVERWGELVCRLNQEWLAETPAPTVDQRVCPICGSHDVEELLMGWYPANDFDAGPSGELHIADLYREKFWCKACDDHVGWLPTEVAKKEEMS
jgi:hypothetical protein